jgi:hypothetical protein
MADGWLVIGFRALLTNIFDWHSDVWLVIFLVTLRAEVTFSSPPPVWHGVISGKTGLNTGFSRGLLQVPKVWRPRHEILAEVFSSSNFPGGDWKRQGTFYSYETKPFDWFMYD